MFVRQIETDSKPPVVSRSEAVRAQYDINSEMEGLYKRYAAAARDFEALLST